MKSSLPGLRCGSGRGLGRGRGSCRLAAAPGIVCARKIAATGRSGRGAVNAGQREGFKRSKAAHRLRRKMIPSASVLGTCLCYMRCAAW